MRLPKLEIWYQALYFLSARRQYAEDLSKCHVPPRYTNRPDFKSGEGPTHSLERLGSLVLDLHLVATSLGAEKIFKAKAA